MTDIHQVDIAAFQEQVNSMIETILYFENLPEEEAVAFSSGSEIAKDEAEKYLQQSNIKQAICKPLEGVTNDVFEISKAITPVLVGAIIAETILIPLNPLIYAWIILIIFRTTIKGFCA